MLETSRRSFITGLISFVAAPAIVRASSLMPIRALPDINHELAIQELTRQMIEHFCSTTNLLQEITADQIINGEAHYKLVEDDNGEISYQRSEPIYQEPSRYELTGLLNKQKETNNGFRLT